MKKTIACCSLLLFIFLQSTAQQKDTAFKKEWMIRFNPFGLADPFETNLSTGVEYVFAERFAVAADVAWVIHGRYFTNSTKSGGILLRPAVRYYFTDKRRGFLELEGHYKQTGYTIHDWLGKNCVDGVPSYEELTDFRFQKKVWGIHVKGGMKAPLSKDKKFWLEGYWGIGFRFRHTSIRNEPNSCYDPNGDLFTPANDDISRPALPIGLRLLYHL